MPFALVIDDSETVGTSMVAMLGVLGVDSHHAMSVRQGILHLESHSPDAVFLDINMPGYDGFEMLAYLKRDPRLEGVPVVVVSSENQSETMAKAKELGAFEFVVKPAMVDDLEGVLQRLGLLAEDGAQEK